MQYKISSKSARNKINSIYFILRFSFCFVAFDLIAIFAVNKKIKEMKRIFLVFVILFSFMSCEKEAMPGEVAVRLFNGLTSGDAAAVKENIYFADRIEYDTFCAYLDMAYDSKDFAERTKGYKADYKVLSEDINGDSAYVVLLGKTVLAQNTRFNVLMVRTDGRWKVDGRFSVFHRQRKD